MSVGKQTFEKSEVKEICRTLARICTPSALIYGIDERFEKWWELNFETEQSKKPRGAEILSPGLKHWKL